MATDAYPHPPTAEELDKLRDLIKEIDFAMLTTVNADGTLHSRPMSTNGDVEFDGDVWFFTYASSHKVDEIQTNPQVNVSYADPKKHSYLSLTGHAQLVRDRAKIDELWKPELNIWFKEGKDNPDIALLKVHVHQAEYWDSPGGPIAKVIALAKLATGSSPSDVGDNVKLDLAA